jgi:hypothetical protein
MSERHCANPLCNCEIAAGRDYCCDGCKEQVLVNIASPCMCGHSTCDGTVRTSLAEG